VPVKTPARTLDTLPAIPVNMERLGKAKAAKQKPPVSRSH
jgi:hypothetical protein